MRDYKEYTILNAKAATGAGLVINVEDFRHCVLTFDTDGGGDAALTVKFAGSISEVAPDFTAAQTPANQYDFIQVKDLEDGASIDGDTGIAVATADDHRQVEANINGLKYLTARVTARTEGEVTVKVRLFNNQ